MNITVVKKHNEKKTFSLTLISLILSVALFLLDRTGFFSPTFWQGMGSLFFIVSFFYIYKFHMTDYTYTLSDDGFVIVKTVGKKSTKVCHIDNDMITHICSLKAWKNDKKIRRIASMYNYNASFSPKDGYVLVFELYGKESAVKFEPSEKMVEGIEKIIRDLKESQ